MSTLLKTLSERGSDLWQATGQHIWLSVVSLLIAIIIAVPLAISVQKHKRIAELLNQIAGILQTIPSLALLGLLIPFVGIGQVPAIIALVTYAIFPIFQNTFVGLSSIDSLLEEAADAFGMTRWEKLRRFELPIAMPVILTGVRQAMVLIVGTATLAALIGSGGLGTFILLGISRNDNSLILIGAIASALVAVIFSGLIQLLQRVRLRTMLISLGVLVVGIAGFETYQGLQKNEPNITIAGKMGSEPEILINMYRDLIQNSDPKVQVTLKPDFGQTSFLFNALKSNQITMYPEFTGTVLQGLVKENRPVQDMNAPQIYRTAKNDLKSQFGMNFAKPMKYNNTYALVVKKSFAAKYHLKTISDLRRISNKLNAGFDLEFIDREDGYRGIKKLYGLKMKYQSMDPDLRYEALNKGAVNIADGYSTDSQIRQYHLVALRDNKQLFPIYQGAPLMKDSFAKNNPKIIKALNKLAGKISEKDMQQMNYEVNVQKRSAATVAKNYLVSQHLIGGK
ncbi:ABC transporter permease/substrate-binding protein [Lentilactobacillus sp. SPB1-3]|uniref:ABC transporter permease/substrate-binding protein n=1 Tax=Lentilactobacillus terminaliae TaxID=3003483 RepID=A0ACD5DFF3_9LACO|nr:ABC transporter permease/substrate-binding protein [Lentilactobacillus sp. SPB1-3]MCZ0977571.1 ABC transporter permease/substrate-binding protein [Lentilactobacillus sp. SPB1-3]